MKIRSITYFLDPGWPIKAKRLEEAGNFLRAALPAFEAAGYEVQTARLASVPFAHLLSTGDVQEATELAQAIEAAARGQGFNYIALGPALPEIPESYALIPHLLAATENAFFSGIMASQEDELSLPAVRACAEIMHQVAPMEPNGFANLRFAALANVPPGAPFFPAAYHAGGEPTFAIACEAADLAVSTFGGAKSLNQGIGELIAVIEQHGAGLGKAGEALSARFGLSFGGIDFSLAPYPEEASSLGTALERLGVPAVGLHGSLAAAAILADALDKADFRRVGFSGLLLPQLEDAILAARGAQGVLTVKDLLMYSAVCGTGLDTIPLPGDTSVEQLAAVLLDLAALAQRLEKPLTARLMPIPGKSAGDETSFDFPYFANSRVLALDAASLEGFLAGEESFSLRARR